MHPLLRRFLHAKKGEPGPDDFRAALETVRLELADTQERIRGLRDQRALALINGGPYKL
jgi:hypothetical protein